MYISYLVNMNWFYKINVLLFNNGLKYVINVVIIRFNEEEGEICL